jgi:membrane-bound lytic murein transglycosylase B
MRILKIFLFFNLILALILPSFSFFAEGYEGSAEVSNEGGKILANSDENKSLDPVEERKVLEEELKKLEEQIAQYEGDISKTEKEKKTLQDQVSVLKKKVDKLGLQIQQSNVIIKDLGFQIKDTETSIGKTSSRIEDSRIQLANILQDIYEEDQRSLIEILLSEKELSDFFDNLMDLEVLNSKNQELLETIKNLKSSLESEKQSLSEEKEDTEGALKIQTLQKKEQQKMKEEKDYFLKLTEAEYQKYLKAKEETEKRAAEIRARIFELIGVPEAPTFGEAYEIAKYVKTLTGVKPALLLAVLTQESNIGKNVGQCFLKNPSTGKGVRLLTGEEVNRVMSPTRDVPYFLKITEELGRDSYNTPVSCPMSVGWGGAMGPAQFIPSTWANSKSGYDEKVKATTGKTADPWNIKDAFLAAGLYLKDLGVMENEFRAVMRYFSGNSWSKWEEFYGNSVMSIAKQYEEDIKEIEGL